MAQSLLLCRDQQGQSLGNEKRGCPFLWSSITASMLITCGVDGWLGIELLNSMAQSLSRAVRFHVRTQHERKGCGSPLQIHFIAVVTAGYFQAGMLTLSGRTFTDHHASAVVYCSFDCVSCWPLM